MLTYDAQDRLTGESSNRFGGQSRTYSLDAAFNRTNLNASNGTNAGQTLSSFTRTQGANGQNQTLGTSTTNVQSGAQTNTSYSYDGEGNRATYADGSQVLTYTYDSQQRLTAVTKYTGGAGQVILKCGYRCDGLRAWKENAQGVRTYFLYDGSNLIGEFDQNGVVKAVQTWGAEGLASRQTTPGIASGNRFYSWDPRGNIAATTDLSGNVLNTPASDGFSSTGGTALEPTATFGGQVGGYRDAETGLVLFGQRYYDPGLGQWITRDPIGEEGGVNLYSYVGGNPVGRVDPSGLDWQLEGAGAAGGTVVIGSAGGSATVGASILGSPVALGAGAAIGGFAVGTLINRRFHISDRIADRLVPDQIGLGPIFCPSKGGKQKGDTDVTRRVRQELQGGKKTVQDIIAELRKEGTFTKQEIDFAEKILGRRNKKKRGK